MRERRRLPLYLVSVQQGWDPTATRSGTVAGGIDRAIPREAYEDSGFDVLAWLVERMTKQMKRTNLTDVARWEWTCSKVFWED